MFWYIKWQFLWNFIVAITFSYTLITQIENETNNSYEIATIRNLIAQMPINNIQTNTIFVYIEIFIISYLYMYIVYFIRIAIDAILLGAFRIFYCNNFKNAS